jgi:NADPH:quinone reductase-like Zn-dependent oxidoreductase
MVDVGAIDGAVGWVGWPGAAHHGGAWGWMMQRVMRLCGSSVMPRYAIAGVVVVINSKVKKLKEGDEVYGHEKVQAIQPGEAIS